MKQTGLRVVCHWCQDRDCKPALRSDAVGSESIELEEDWQLVEIALRSTPQGCAVLRQHYFCSSECKQGAEQRLRTFGVGFDGFYARCLSCRGEGEATFVEVERQGRLTRVLAAPDGWLRVDSLEFGSDASTGVVVQFVCPECRARFKLVESEH